MRIQYGRDADAIENVAFETDMRKNLACQKERLKLLFCFGKFTNIILLKKSKNTVMQYEIYGKVT